MKTINVVGNARSIRSRQYGKLIDEGDCVIRFNLGCIHRTKWNKNLGTKTNVVVFSDKNGIWRRSTHYRIAYMRTKSWFTHEWPERTYLLEILGSPPSNGIMVLERLKNNYPNACVRLFGFDWKETDSFYQPREETKHNYKKEEEYCRKLIKENNWELYQ